MYVLDFVCNYIFLDKQSHWQDRQVRHVNGLLRAPSVPIIIVVQGAAAAEQEEEEGQEKVINEEEKENNAGEDVNEEMQIYCL